MSDYDFTYEVPSNFEQRIIQFLQQLGQNETACVQAFQRCHYEYQDIGFAYYAGIKGDNWNKRAIDFTVEGNIADITMLKNIKSKLKSAVEKAIKPNESGFLIHDIFFIEEIVVTKNITMPLSDEARLNIDIENAEKVLADLVQISERACIGSVKFSDSEDEINDYYRDMFFAKDYHEIKDQTRHGISASGKSAGRVDILLTKQGKEIAILECLKLDCINANYIDEHISKAITNYNALGTATFILVYVSCDNFETFWFKYSEHIRNYGFPIQVKKAFNLLTSPNASIRIATQILSRDGYNFPVYYVAVKLK